MKNSDRKQVVQAILSATKALEAAGRSSDNAQAVYMDRRVEAKKLISEIDRLLDRHYSEQKRQPRNWGYAGDLGSILESLRDVVDKLR